MPAKQPSPRRVAAAVHAVSTGRSLRDVAEEYGVSYVTVLRWVNKAKAEGGGAKQAAKSEPPWKGLTSTLAERARVFPEADDVEPEPAEGGTLLEQVRALQRDMLATARQAKGVGNMKAAQAALASAGLLANTIARIAKTEAEGADTVKFSRAALAEAEDRVRDYVTAIVGRGECRCADCSRALSVSWGEEAKARKAEEPEGAPHAAE
jgi:transposase-like protein